ncbi:putative sulfate/molybdate transporter [Halovivax sp.]|uniref:putative sulfate/molybdate transporter n=1 Tax=Halovivax sp. TaxID=1935978 RepID=UPI0025C65427|nr:putative sulfate/molybdate transporter [Halovivax sp.]
MAVSVSFRGDQSVEIAWNEVTGAIGDSVTVLPIVVAVAVLTELSLAVMLLWFGLFQVVWGLYYGVPLSVEPMKALAALVLAGSLATGEFLVAGLLAGGALLLIGATGTLARVERYVGAPVVRGIQLGVALVLLETGLRLGAADLRLAGVATVVAVLIVAAGHWNLSALVVLLLGGGVAASVAGAPSPALPGIDGVLLIGAGDLTLAAAEASLAQLAMTIGNAALATSLLLSDYFDREVSPDRLASSMGVTNLAAVPFGAFPMCHGSGGVAGKYAFGARTAGANVVLGVGYVAVALLAVGLVAAYPVAMLGVVLALIALQLGRTSLERAAAYPLVIAVGLLGLTVNLGAAFVAGIVAYHLLRYRRGG